LHQYQENGPFYSDSVVCNTRALSMDADQCSNLTTRAQCCEPRLASVLRDSIRKGFQLIMRHHKLKSLIMRLAKQDPRKICETRIGGREDPPPAKWYGSSFIDTTPFLLGGLRPDIGSSGSHC